MMLPNIEHTLNCCVAGFQVITSKKLAQNVQEVKLCLPAPKRFLILPSASPRSLQERRNASGGFRHHRAVPAIPEGPIEPARSFRERDPNKTRPA